MISLRRRGPFADPRFRRLLAGQSLSTFGDTALYLTLGIWAKALTGSNAAAGAVFLAPGAVYHQARAGQAEVPGGFGVGHGHVRQRRHPRGGGNAPPRARLKH
jgi:hypothetical protein